MGSVARIQVRAVPNSHRAAIVGRYGGGWKVRVTAPPERGRANGELVRLLSDVLGVERGAIQVIAGPGGRDKIVEIRGLTLAAVEERLLAHESP